MRTISITDVKANFSRLMNEAAKGDSFLISKSGKIVAIVESVDKGVIRHSNNIAGE